MRIQKQGRRLVTLKLSGFFFLLKDNPIVDNTNGVENTVFTFHIPVSSSFRSAYFCSFSVTVL
jgi:hypothetical protein